MPVRATSLHATKLPLVRRFSLPQIVHRHCTPPDVSMASITDSHRKFFKGAEAVVKKKIQELKNRRRCLTCWHPKHLFCICNHTPALKYKLANVKFIIYMHYLEYANAGDDAKLLMCCSPERTKLYLHGVERDDANMKKEIQAFKSTSLDHNEGVVLLFPGPNSITIDSFLEQRARKTNRVMHHKGTEISCKVGSPPPLLVIVMDATWRRARRMANHFRKYIDPNVPHIQLRPTTASIYARTQSQNGRICTIEALALLLKEYGEDEDICDKLIGYVQLNNRALTCEFKNRDQILWEYGNNLSDGNGGHPAWYFGRTLIQEQSSADNSGEVNRNAANAKPKEIVKKTYNIIDAARLGMVEQVKQILINAKGLVNFTNQYGWAAIHKACFKGHLAIVKELIQSGANVNLKTNDGNTPILLAAWKGKSSVVQYLLENNADSTAKNSKGQTARSVSMQKRHKLCIQALDRFSSNKNKALPMKRKQDALSE